MISILVETDSIIQMSKNNSGSFAKYRGIDTFNKKKTRDPANIIAGIGDEIGSDILSYGNRSIAKQKSIKNTDDIIKFIK